MSSNSAKKSVGALYGQVIVVATGPPRPEPAFVPVYIPTVTSSSVNSSRK